MYSEHCQTFEMECFAKRIMPERRRTTINFLGQGERGEAVKLVHLDKYVVKNARKKRPHRKTF